MAVAAGGCSFDSTSESLTGMPVDAAAIASPDSAPSLCGNGRADPGEQCDDGNPHPGDGCDATCHIEPAHECPAAGACSQVVGLAFTRAGDLAASGTSMGGTMFTHACPAGAAIVGFDGLDSDDHMMIGSVRAECAVIAMLANGSISWSTTTETGYQGTENTGNLGATTCHSNELVVGFIGYAGQYLDGLQLLCMPVSQLHGTLVFGAARTATGWGHTVPANALAATQCPPGQAAATYTGKSGAVLDHFDVSCSVIAAVTN